MIEPQLTTDRANPDLDAIAHWRGLCLPHSIPYGVPSKCRLRIWQSLNEQKTVVLLSDLDLENCGASITNCVENLISSISFRYDLGDRTMWIEHYPHHNSNKTPIFDEVHPQPQCDHPLWTGTDAETVRNAIAKCRQLDDPGSISLDMNDTDGLPSVSLDPIQKRSDPAIQKSQ